MRIAEELGVNPRKLLGDEGERLIMRGGKYDSIDLRRDIYLGDDLFRFDIDGAASSES